MSSTGKEKNVPFKKDVTVKNIEPFYLIISHCYRLFKYEISHGKHTVQVFPLFAFLSLFNLRR